MLTTFSSQIQDVCITNGLMDIGKLLQGLSQKLYPNFQKQEMSLQITMF